MTSATPLLAARGAGRRFGHRAALEPVELEVWDGEAVALVGPNGAGKSTLLALLAGALEVSVGAIERRKGARVGWAPQRPAQYGRLSARENLELFARLEGEHDSHAVTERLLGEFELPDEAEPSANLSVGNRQRLNLAIALLGRPQVLLLDEPTAALDPEQRARLWKRVAELRATGGAVVFATQNLEEVERIADRVAALRDGRLVYAGSAGEYDRAHVETLSA
ncbi:MAG TPA: ABC transporter ATP-binding protein [Gaiellaceae bacterium]|nr:ABC transporter ATP-binding protein [Gaiellaceae bacterium]